MASTVIVTVVRSASGGIFRKDKVSQRRPELPSTGSCKLTNVDEKSVTAAPGYCKVALHTDQSEASSKVKQTLALTCFASRQARSTRTSMPLVCWMLVIGAAATVGYEGSI